MSQKLKTFAGFALRAPVIEPVAGFVGFEISAHVDQGSAFFANRRQGFAVKLLAENRVRKGYDDCVELTFGKWVIDKFYAAAAFEMIVEGTQIPELMFEDDGDVVRIFFQQVLRSI